MFNEWAIKGLGYGIMIAIAIVTAVAIIGSVAWVLGFVLNLLCGGEDEDEDEENDSTGESD